MTRIFIGDVQGCIAELEALLAKLDVGSTDDLYFVGDLINRGPASAAVLRLFAELGAVSVLGNHEEHLIEGGLFAEQKPEPDRFPGCRDLVAAPDRRELGELVRSLPLALELDDVLLVHAACPPSLWQAREFAEPAADERSFVLSARHCDPSGTRPDSEWPPPAAPFAPWHRFYAAPWTVVFGHWARQGLLVESRLRGLDTSCVYGGKLTAWIAEEDRIVQVPARRAYYP